MRNTLFHWPTRTIKRGAGVVSSLVLVILLAAMAGLWTSNDGFRSVEFGLAELSPSGEMGGYAVPASGASNGPLDVSYVCDSSGSNITLTVSFSYSILETPANTSIDINGTYYGTIFGSGYTRTQSGGTYTASRSFTFPASGTYTVLFTGQFGTGGRNNPARPFSYTASVTPSCEDHTNDPAVDLEVNNDAVGPEWVDGPITINPTDDLDLRWQSSNVTSCSGNNFTVPSNAVDGTQVYVTNPPAGTSRTYTIICTGSNGSANDSVVVNATGSGAGGPPSLTGIPVYVIRGDDADLDWDTNGSDPASCILTGPNVSVSPLSAATGTYTVTIYGESTYTLQCPGGTDTTTIRVLPELQET